MTADDAARAIQHYKLDVGPPTRGKVAPGTQWLVRCPAGRCGFGDTFLDAVEDWLKFQAAPADKPETDSLLL